MSEVAENNILLAMPMFNNGGSFNVREVIDNLKSKWGLEVVNVEGDEHIITLDINGETVALAYMPVPIPLGDIEGIAQYAYNWPTAVDDLKYHTGHAIVSVMAGKKSVLERFKILSKVIGSVLIASDAVGLYDGNQSLLIPKSQYLANLEVLEYDDIPVSLWIYIGLQKRQAGNCVYTYGLKAFQKKEIEIIDSNLTLEELFDFLFSVVSYIIGSDITLKNGETIGLTADQKISVIVSKGRFVEGQSIKLKL
ncbi:DUF4261 domain-containing protein [Mucilaginibacter flavus]|uniref:DUF4261 domain-containing protein n=1 Tax=Mucilaginibacter flavus TaxID=931504 RepID=UPI0025B43EE6|nr:DUF4261 domain-containing protein [Mucilaginibacter flavus]MDN3583699.1 DUF4261 domain-containing protein [Mucilaginibacter flavus]